MLETLSRGEAAVQTHHTKAAQPFLKTAQELRREINLRHHHQHLAVGLVAQNPFGGLQIHLGFAAARHAK